MNTKAYKNIAASRSLYLVDAENAVGASEIEQFQVHAMKKRVFELVKPGAMDQFYVTSSHHNQQATMFGWPEGEHKFKSGKDGADILLASRILDGNLAEKFGHIIIASGDGGLVPFAEHLMKQGVKVTFICQMRSCSHLVRESGADILWIDSTHELAA